MEIVEKGLIEKRSNRILDADGDCLMLMEDDANPFLGTRGEEKKEKEGGENVEKEEKKEVDQRKQQQVEPENDAMDVEELGGEDSGNVEAKPDGVEGKEEEKDESKEEENEEEQPVSAAVMKKIQSLESEVTEVLENVHVKERLDDHKDLMWWLNTEVLRKIMIILAFWAFVVMLTMNSYLT